MILAVVLIFLAAADIVTSLVGFQRGFPEAAPVMAGAVTLGPLWIIPLKLALTAVVLVLLTRVRTRRTTLAWVIALGIFAVPVINNFLLIQGA